MNQLIKDDSQKKSDLNYLYKSSSATNFQIVNLDKEKIDDNALIFNSLELKSDTLFSAQDIEYLISQTIPYNSQEFDLDPEKIHTKTAVIKNEDLNEIKENYPNAKEYWRRFNLKFGEKCIRNYSEPIFNLKKNICIIRISESCGPLWGGGSTGIFKKLKGRWVEIKSQNHWVN
ncbi:hypothetical protein [Kaistella yonginensis]|uniref:hypothetical protein n=1 Tax=Kaistella yonginensis TaxID=658267 RepID=UPI0025B2A551|nr:hypothetical protein [Kaistella yonginensis]MDN3606017.1 hypothetical protein [Kaistella yonginensis]